MASEAQDKPRVSNDDLVVILKQLGVNEKNAGDRFRASAYRNAAQAIAAHPTPITSGEEARQIPGIGAKIAKKIDEILATGKLNKLELANADERTRALNLLSRVSGIGPAAAGKFVDAGVTTLEQLATQPLNHYQRVGLKYFADFEARIPRAEMQLLEGFVQRVVSGISPRIIVNACGSYRRGALSSGDIDFLLTHPEYTSSKHAAANPHSLAPSQVGGQGKGTLESFFSKADKKRKRERSPSPSPEPKHRKTHPNAAPGQRGANEGKGEGEGEEEEKRAEDQGEEFEVTQLLQRVVKALHQCGFLTDDLVSGQNKYMGVCKLPEEEWEEVPETTFHRRIDIRLFPIETYHTALLYFTGSDGLNKQMRQRAIDLKFHLSEYAICAVGEKGEKGDPLPVSCERDVFEYLNMDYLEPHQRSI